MRVTSCDTSCPLGRPATKFPGFCTPPRAPPGPTPCFPFPHRPVPSPLRSLPPCRELPSAHLWCLPARPGSGGQGQMSSGDGEGNKQREHLRNRQPGSDRTGHGARFHPWSAPSQEAQAALAPFAAAAEDAWRRSRGCRRRAGAGLPRGRKRSRQSSEPRRCAASGRASLRRVVKLPGKPVRTDGAWARVQEAAASRSGASRHAATRNATGAAARGARPCAD